MKCIECVEWARTRVPRKCTNNISNSEFLYFIGSHTAFRSTACSAAGKWCANFDFLANSVCDHCQVEFLCKILLLFEHIPKTSLHDSSSLNFSRQQPFEIAIYRDVDHIEIFHTCCISFECLFSDRSQTSNQFEIVNVNERDDSEDAEYWQKYQHMITPEREKVWDALLYSFEKY